MTDIFKNKEMILKENIEDIKDVLLKKEELLNHASLLAQNHRLERKLGSTKILGKRLERNYKGIFSIYKELNNVANTGGDLSPASEWLLDNFYKIEEQVKDVKQNLEADRFVRLPTLAGSHLKGYPRAYAIALELVSHSDGRVDEETLIGFTKVYQSAQIMTIGEIWSLSLMLRIALIENIRIISGMIYNTQIQWAMAEKALQLDEEALFKEIDGSLNKGLELSYIEHMLAKIRREGLDLNDVQYYIDLKLEEYNTTINDIIKNEHKNHAIRRISIGNSITSLHGISTLNWNDIFESISVVEKKLKNDPSAVYAKMDFESRDYYRKVIERISKQWKITEIKIANQAISLANEAAKDEKPEKEKHVGYYLIDKGRGRLFKSLKIGKDYFKLESISLYALSILIISILVTFLSFNVIYNGSYISLLLILPFIFISSSEVAVTTTNYLFMKSYPPTFLPRLEYIDEIPKEAATMVIIPSLLINKKDAEELVKKMEVYYLANKDNNLYFSIVGDFVDAEKKVLDDDNEILETGIEEVKKLNDKYAKEKERFFYFHRRRIFNESQKRWMGWERKRGAIIELNNFLKGDNDTFQVKPEAKSLEGLRYIITIDADTNLKMNSAKKLIGIIQHPLNKAVYDNNSRLIVEGYGIIQPRIGLNIEDTSKTVFTKIYTHCKGIDPYTTAVSDVYQDAFGEGIFTGKGIYDLKYFNNVMENKIQENTILSHDLLEGSLMKTGLASDVELIDGYPAKYKSYTMRLHRWTRGDWQLIKWLFNKKLLSPLSRWKIADNLRRSLVAPSLFLIILLGAVIYKINFLAIAGFSALILFYPSLLNIIDTLFSGKKYFIEAFVLLRKGIHRMLFQFTFLPYNAYLMMDAVVRTLFRVFISKKNLLEWVTAAEAEKKLKDKKKDYFIKMKASLFLTSFLAVLILFVDRRNFLYYVPFAVLWLFAPYIAYEISVVDEKEKYNFNDNESKDLKRISRKTWAYFEDFIKEEYNYLPPDNFQEYPFKGVATRTSPTNIGLYLVSILTARDFGFITTSELVEKVSDTLNTIERMETWKGHLFNWYDIKTLEVLRPYYVSTVDSGNFVTYLLLLRQGLKEYCNKPIIDINILTGLKDTHGTYCCNDYNLEEITGMLDKSKQLIYLMNAIDDIKNVAYSDFENEKKTLHLFNTIYRDFNKFYPGEESMEIIKELSWDINDELHSNPQLSTLNNTYIKIKEEIKQMIETVGEDRKLSLAKIDKDITAKMENVKELIKSIDELVKIIDIIIENMEFNHLYSNKRNLFSIGYDVEKESITNSYYDLLASEARTASYWSIITGQIPLEHWYKLGRSLTKTNGSRALVSWTGTMFEYFMPALILKSYDGTLFNETYSAVIEAQKKYGSRLNIPWGVSESGFFSFDFNLNYQYKAFGMPDLGLKRGLIEDVVISPYSTLLAINDSPESAIHNLEKLIGIGMEGEYGFYEAIDFTYNRLRKDKEWEIVKSFMAHHLGMSMLALGNFLNESVMINRFHDSPLIKAGEFMLQERLPMKSVITKEYKEWLEEKGDYAREYIEPVRVYEESDFIPPPCHLLSNGNYTILINTRGGGFSKYNETFINRWRNEYIDEIYGNFIFIKNTVSGKIWSAYKALDEEPDGYKVVFLPSRVEFIRKDEDIHSITEVFVSPEDNVEIRRLKIENHSQESITFEITSFSELTLAPLADDIAHKAFSNLFIRTEFVEEFDSIIGVRKHRDSRISDIYAFHLAFCDGDLVGPVQYETSRENFIGRERSVGNSISMNQPLSNTIGTVLDPCMSIRKRIRIKPGQMTAISFITGYGNSKPEVLDLSAKYFDSSAIQRAYDLAITRSQVEAAYLSLTSKEILSYDNMIAHLIYRSPLKRLFKKQIRENNKGQSSLWTYGISGDSPIILVLIRHEQDIPMLKQSLKAHEYLSVKGLQLDLLILNEDESNYLQPLRGMINDIVEKSSRRNLFGKESKIFVKNLSSVPKEDVSLLYASARVVLRGNAGPIEKQVKYIKQCHCKIKEKLENRIDETRLSEEELLYFNGYGGFNAHGNEYIIRLLTGSNLPAPWINVISNKDFGFTISENGSGYVWSENSRENKLTPWNNDPVSDEINEIVYMKDRKTRDVWSITKKPIKGRNECKVTHGWGYTIFHRSCFDIEQEMTVFVPMEDSIKVTLIKLKNKSKEKREISITYYIEPVLGVHEHFNRHHIYTEMDNNEILLLKNNFNNDFQNRIAFMFSSDKIQSYTGDKCTFMGLGGDKKQPSSLDKDNLECIVGIYNEPCGAIQMYVDLEPDEEKEIALYFGQVLNQEILKDYSVRYYRLKYAKTQLAKVIKFWTDTTSVIKVKTPDNTMDLMLNGWLIYQTIGCRLWARSALYQSGGAFGFRDQLQDTANMSLITPDLLRKQILLHAEHQFIEGDVLHWWHPMEHSKGVRTKFSDDLLWLPYSVIRYIETTGDHTILEEKATFLEHQILNEEEDERYVIPCISSHKETVYEHCNRAIEKSLKTGENGLPLMGSGDWNDGMNNIGNKGKGESVWLAFFLYSILIEYIGLCHFMKEENRAERYKDFAINLKASIEKNGWDGNWYKRAYFDDGTPLGSVENSECTIDSIVQSWSVLSKAADKERCEVAMESLKRYLIKEDEGMILLFTPPFEKSEKNPGYIKSYVPGVRENGGQYTHAASWVICAFASLGKGNLALNLYNMLNPINHTKTVKECSIYKTEPYVMAADVYSVNPHVGRGGWSWYTGAAGWFYRAGIEHILGFKKIHDRLYIEPCIPEHWEGFEIVYRYVETKYYIKVTNPEKVSTGIKYIQVDGVKHLGNNILLVDDEKEHEIIIIMGNKR